MADFDLVFMSLFKDFSQYEHLVDCSLSKSETVLKQCKNISLPYPMQIRTRYLFPSLEEYAFYRIFINHAYACLDFLKLSAFRWFFFEVSIVNTVARRYWDMFAHSPRMSNIEIELESAKLIGKLLGCPL